MKRGERTRDRLIAQRGQPVRLLRGQPFEIATHDVQEHELAQPAEHALTADARRLRLRERKAHVSRERAVRVIAHTNHSWQRCEERIERPRIAAEKTAYEVRV